MAAQQCGMQRVAPLHVDGTHCGHCQATYRMTLLCPPAVAAEMQRRLAPGPIEKYPPLFPRLEDEAKELLITKPPVRAVF